MLRCRFRKMDVLSRVSDFAAHRVLLICWDSPEPLVGGLSNPRFNLTSFGPRATLDKTRPFGLILQVKRKHVRPTMEHGS